MRVLVGCEFSGIVRDAFIARGHYAISCDLLPSEHSGPHYQGDVRDICNDDSFDLFIAFPPCTYLAVSGNAYYRGTETERRALVFVLSLLDSPIKRIAIENPKGVLSRYYRKPDQIVHPWQFGHSVSKATCLWLRNLPLLAPTRVVDYQVDYIENIPVPRTIRQRERSRTFQGIADAMAEQWTI